MKIIEDNSDKVPFWIGKRGRCYKCGSIVELEAGDEVSIGETLSIKGNKKVATAMAPCPACVDGGVAIKDE